MIKIGIVGIAAAFFSLLIKKDKPEIAAGLSVCASLLIFFMAIKQLSAVIEFVKEVIRQLPVETSYFATMLKMLGIAYSAEFSSQICKDSGHGAIAAQIDFFAKTAIVMMSIPTLVYLAKIYGGYHVKRAGIFMIMLLYFTILFGKNICMASETTEKEQADDNAIEEFYYQKIMDETDFGDIEKVSKEYVPDKMTFTGLVHDIAQQKEERPWEIIGRYIYDIFFFEVENVKPQVVSVLIYTVMFAVLSKLIFWEKNYVYNVSFLLVYASIMVLLISTFDIMGDLVSDGIDVLLPKIRFLIPQEPWHMPEQVL